MYNFGDWADFMREQFAQPYFLSLADFLKKEWEAGKVIYPAKENIFRAFELTQYRDIKVVILGQDCYHTTNKKGEGIADGLAFSTYPSNAIPASLRRVYEEVANDTGSAIQSHGSLIKWADQGVLLLNTALTVEKGKPGSHSNIGWQIFTNNVITVINQKKNPVVFMMWGKHAQSKKHLINNPKHCMLIAGHPSPLNTSNPFTGCKNFSKANNFLEIHGIKPIEW